MNIYLHSVFKYGTLHCYSGYIEVTRWIKLWFWRWSQNWTRSSKDTDYLNHFDYLFFYLVLLRVDGIPAEVQGFPRPPLIWVVWLKLRHWPRTKFLGSDLVMFSSSLSFSTFSVSAMFCWASSQIPLLPVSLSACCRHPGLCFQLVSQLLWQFPNRPSQHCRFSAQLILNAICSTAFLEHAGNLLNPLIQASG